MKRQNGGREFIPEDIIDGFIEDLDRTMTITSKNFSLDYIIYDYKKDKRVIVKIDVLIITLIVKVPSEDSGEQIIATDWNVSPTYVYK